MTRREIPAIRGCAVYRDLVESDVGTPIFASLVSELQLARASAESRVADLGRLLADLEALHEPDSNGDCPTCVTPAPCLTSRVLRGEISYDDACANLREQRAIELTLDEERVAPAIPTLAELLATPTPAVDRVFETLIGKDPSEGDRRSA